MYGCFVNTCVLISNLNLLVQSFHLSIPIQLVSLCNLCHFEEVNYIDFRSKSEDEKVAVLGLREV